MAFKQQKAATKPAPAIPKDYPEFPTMPPDIIRNPAAVQAHANAQNAWWTTMKQHLQDIESRITALEK